MLVRSVGKLLPTVFLKFFKITITMLDILLAEIKENSNWIRSYMVINDTVLFVVKNKPYKVLCDEKAQRFVLESMLDNNTLHESNSPREIINFIII